MRLLNAFVRHAKPDRALARNLALSLGRRGVVAWLDQDEALRKVSLDLARAIASHMSVQDSAAVAISESLAKCATHPDCGVGMAHENPHNPQ